MIIPILSIAIGLILIVILIIYNLRSFSSTSKRSERQYPAAERHEENMEKPESSDVAKTTLVTQQDSPFTAHSESSRSSSESIPVRDKPSALQRSDSDETLRPVNNHKIDDQDYRKALQKFRQPDKPERSKDNPDKEPMKDDDFRAALRSMTCNREDKQ